MSDKTYMMIFLISSAIAFIGYSILFIKASFDKEAHMSPTASAVVFLVFLAAIVGILSGAVIMAVPKLIEEIIEVLK